MGQGVPPLAPVFPAKAGLTVEKATERRRDGGLSDFGTPAFPGATCPPFVGHSGGSGELRSRSALPTLRASTPSSLCHFVTSSLPLRAFTLRGLRLPQLRGVRSDWPVDHDSAARFGLQRSCSGHTGKSGPANWPNNWPNNWSKRGARPEGHARIVMFRTVRRSRKKRITGRRGRYRPDSAEYFHPPRWVQEDRHQFPGPPPFRAHRHAGRDGGCCGTVR